MMVVWLAVVVMEVVVGPEYCSTLSVITGSRAKEDGSEGRKRTGITNTQV